MLYERWLQVAQERRSEFALREVATGREWTFDELRVEGERLPVDNRSVAFPQNHSAEFILTVLAGWRSGKAVCPVEPDQASPVIPKPPANCAHLKITSATTGRPRLILFTAKQLMADAENIVATMRLRPDWPNVGVISLAHSYGFSNLVLPLLLHGIPLILGSSALPEPVRRICAGCEAVTLPGVPALWRAWLEGGAIARSVRLAISAGAPLPVALEQEVYNATGLKIHNFYGSSECGGIAYDASATPRQDGAFVGTVMRNVDVSCNDSGCLEVRSQAAGETYWPDADDALANGCFRTSDLAEVKDGTVCLRGRTGDLINVAGRKVAPELIERAIFQHPGVRECLVLGIPNMVGERTEAILAIVAADATVETDALKRFLLEKLPAWQVPREWWFIDEIGVNRRGKVSRVEWRERFLQRERSL